MHLSPQSPPRPLANIVSSKSQISLSAHFSLRVTQNKNRRARFFEILRGCVDMIWNKKKPLISYRKNITNISFLLAVFDFKSTTKVFLSILFHFYFVHSPIYVCTYICWCVNQTTELSQISYPDFLRLYYFLESYRRQSFNIVRRARADERAVTAQYVKIEHTCQPSLTAAWKFSRFFLPPKK